MTTPDSTFAIRHSPPWSGGPAWRQNRGAMVLRQKVFAGVVIMANVWAWGATSNVVEQWCQSHDVG